MTAHPVTLGDLWKPDPSGVGICPATVADLISPEIRPLVVSALRAEGVLVVEKVDDALLDCVENVLRAWAPDLNDGAMEQLIDEVLDALAEAQP